jgi:PAS domain S-box-containing protein
MIQYDHIYDCDTPESCLALFAQYNDLPWPFTVADMSAPDSPLVYANTAFYALTLYEPSEILGVNCRVLRGNAMRDESVDKIRQALNARQSIEIDILNYRKNGEPFWNLLSLLPIKTRNPALDYFMGLQMDVSALRNLGAKKLSLNDLHNERLKTIGAMSAGIAHEINNPVFGALMNIRFLKAKIQDPSLLEALNQSQKELERVGKIVKNLLGFSRKKEMYHNTKLSLESLIFDTIELVRTQIHQNWIQIEMNVSASLPLVFANEDGVKQILLNLMINAVQAMSEVNSPKAKIVVSAIACHVNHQVIVSVTDNGPGVPIMVRDKIFMPFFSTKKEGQGTGLGLSLAVSMAKDFAGSLTLDICYDSGARFLLAIPMFSELSEHSKIVDPTCTTDTKCL